MDLDSALVEADRLFTEKSWERAASVYTSMLPNIEAIWRNTFFNLESPLLTPVYSNLAFCLAQLGHVRDAILALEACQAQSLARLQYIKSGQPNNRLFTNDIRTQEYLHLAKEFVDLQCQARHPTFYETVRRGVAVTASRLAGNDEDVIIAMSAAHEIQRRISELTSSYEHPDRDVEDLSPEQSSELASLQSELKSRMDYLRARPAPIPDHNQEIIARLIKASNELDKHVDHFQVSWLRPTWEEVVDAIRINHEDGHFPALEQHAVIYITSTKFGALFFLIEPDGAQIKQSARFHPYMTTQKVRELSSLFEASRLGESFDGKDELSQQLFTLLTFVWTFCTREIVRVISDAGWDTAVLIPVGPMASLPLHAAIDDSAPGGPTAALERVAFSYAPSCRSLRRSKDIANRMQSNHPEMFGLYDPSPSSQEALPYSSVELRATSSRFYFPWGPHRVQTADLVTGSRACRYRVSSALASGQKTIAHFACHSAINEKSPLDSGIVLAHDELYYATDALTNDAEIRLTFLSSCHSDFSGATPEGEWLGFPGIFLVAGSAGVVTTMWPISDLPSALIAMRFYEYWLDEHLPPVKALARAQQWVMRASLREKLDHYRPGRLDAIINSGVDLPGLKEDWENLRRAILENAEDTSIRSPLTWAAYRLCGV